MMAVRIVPEGLRMNIKSQSYLLITTQLPWHLDIVSHPQTDQELFKWFRFHVLIFAASSNHLGCKALMTRLATTRGDSWYVYLHLVTLFRVFT